MDRVGPEIDDLPFSIPFKTLFLEGNFHEIAFISVPRVPEMGPEKNGHTDIRTEFGRSEAPLGPGFEQLRC